MNRMAAFGFLLMAAIALAPAAAAPAPADERLERLTPEHRDWLEREVVYIITDREREVFLALETLEERERFIEAFWRKRDPNPATPVNEFRDEHYRRIEHANKFLGRETFREGWRTDRGRMYILLGEPREIQRYDGYNELVSTELWFYEGDATRGLPAFFYLMFFKRHDVGEYQLYHPVIDGPQALLRGQYTHSGNVHQSLDVLERISPELARASLSFDTSDPADFVGGRASLGTDLLLARIEDSPKRAIRTDYADAWERYGRMVSAEYSFNFVPSRSVFAVLAGPDGTPFVHYSIELDPQNFTLETDEDQTKFYTTLDITLEVRGPEDTLVVAHDREVYLELTPSQVEQVKASPFAFQDDFPLVPGDYKISVILRNRVLTQYTVAEEEIHVPSFTGGGPVMSDLVLGFDSELAANVEEGELRTFQVGAQRIYPSTEGIFVLGDTIHAFLQVTGASPDHRLRFALLSGEEVLQEKASRLGDYQGGPVVEEFPLLKMIGGNYILRAELLDPSGAQVTSTQADVQVSPRSAIPRAGFIYRRGFNTKVPGLLALARGEQLAALGRAEEARAELEKAVAAANPQLPMARWKLAGLLIRTQETDRVLELLEPLEAEFPNQFEVMAGLGFAHYLKDDYEKALTYLEKAMSLRPPDTSLLNALGDTHQQLGNPRKARELFERSLQLDPDQAAVKERLSALGTGNENP